MKKINIAVSIALIGSKACVIDIKIVCNIHLKVIGDLGSFHFLKKIMISISCVLCQGVKYVIKQSSFVISSNFSFILVIFQ